MHETEAILRKECEIALSKININREENKWIEDNMRYMICKHVNKMSMKHGLSKFKKWGIDVSKKCDALKWILSEAESKKWGILIPN
jgi:hypothetical protein